MKKFFDAQVDELIGSFGLHLRLPMQSVFFGTQKRQIAFIRTLVH